MAIAEFLAEMFEGVWNAFVWLVMMLLGLPAPGIVAALVAAAFLVWRLSLVFGPQKNCYRCGATGARTGVLGGRKTCSRCSGSGLVDRIGVKK